MSLASSGHPLELELDSYLSKSHERRMVAKTKQKLCFWKERNGAEKQVELATAIVEEVTCGPLKHRWIW